MPWSGDQLRVTHRDEDGRTVLTLAGVVDVLTTPILRDRLIDLRESGARHVVLDLGAVELIDSGGLGMLVGARKRYRDVGGDIRLRSPSRQLMRLLEMTGLSNVFTIEP